MHSLLARLTLGFFAIAAVAVGLVSVAVLPGLEQRLVDAKLQDLTELSGQYSPALREAVGTSVPQSRLKALVQSTADTVGTRVTVLLVVNTDEGTTVEPGTDSAAERQVTLDFPVAIEAPSSRKR